MIALREAWREGLLRPIHWWPNCVAGGIVGIVALPLAMAFAIASGARPEQGIYTAIVAGILVSIFGGSRVQIAGPTGAFIVILSGITAKYGIEGLQIATLMAGVMLLLLGLARFGSVIKFIPDPVIVGFTAGIAVIIWIGQWPSFFGIADVSGAHFHEKFWHLLQALPQWHASSTALAMLALAIIVFSPKIAYVKKIPGPLSAMLVIGYLQWQFEFVGVQTLGDVFGGIPQGLPSFALPTVSMSRLIELMLPAFTIAMLGAIESLLSAVVADGMTGTKHHSNQELVGQGVANIFAPLFGGFAATGALARTATNVRSGGNSPIAGIVHSLVLICILLFLAPLASHIPMCALAAILFVVAFKMCDLKHFMHILRRAPRADVVILLITFALTILVDLVIAVNIGVILAVLQFMRRMAASVEVNALSETDLTHELQALGLHGLPDGVAVYAVEGPFFFGAVEQFEYALSRALSSPQVLILRLRRVPFIDITGVRILTDVVRDLHKRGVRVMLTEANPVVSGKLQRAGVMALIGDENVFAVFAQAIRQSTQKLTVQSAS